MIATFYISDKRNCLQEHKFFMCVNSWIIIQMQVFFAVNSAPVIQLHVSVIFPELFFFFSEGKNIKKQRMQVNNCSRKQETDRRSLSVSKH